MELVLLNQENVEILAIAVHQVHSKGNKSSRKVSLPVHNPRARVRQLINLEFQTKTVARPHNLPMNPIKTKELERFSYEI